MNSHMSNLEDIAADIRALRTGVDRARTDTAAANHHAEEIIKRAMAAGFGGIAQNLSRVRDAIGEIQAGLARADATINDVDRSVTGAPREPSPEQTITVLNPALHGVTTIRDTIAATISKITDVQRLVASVLDGGTPGPLLARLNDIRQTLIMVSQRCDAGKEHIGAAITQARQTGHAAATH